MSSLTEQPRATPPGNGIAGLRQAWLGIDRNPAAVAWAKTPLGLAVIHLAFFAGLVATTNLSMQRLGLIALGLIGCVVVPGQRMLILALIGLFLILVKPFRDQWLVDHFHLLWQSGGGLGGQMAISMAGGCFLLLVYAGIRFALRGKAGPVGQRPVLALMAVLAVVTGLVALTPQTSLLHAAAWTLCTLLSSVFFFIAYLLAENKAGRGIEPHLQLGFLRPLWPVGFVPVKGPGFLKKFEAGDVDDLARIRLKALKLIVWAVILLVTARLIEGLVFNRLGLPTLDGAIIRLAAGDPAGAGLSWLVVMVNLLHQVLVFGIFIHTVVATIRLVGFDIPRGMARPLSSRTISEFWGRYLFYFKELLADFFFYPTFARFFKRNQGLRIAFAIFMAASVGNVLFDVIAALPMVSTQGVWATVLDFQSYVVYATILAIGLILSQMYEKPTKPADGRLKHDIMPRVRVILFFALLLIFDSSTDDIPLVDRFNFFTSLFGV